LIGKRGLDFRREHGFFVGLVGYGCASDRVRVRMGLEAVTRISAQVFRIQLAPASRKAAGGDVVLKAMTLAAADFPARIPAGASSSTTHWAAENPSSDAPFR